MSEQEAKKNDILGSSGFTPLGPMGDNGAPTRMYVGVRNNNVSFSAKIDGQYQNLRLSPVDFIMLLDTIRIACQQKEEFKESVQVTVGQGDKKRQAVLTVGRDTDGVIFVALTVPNHPPARFNLLPSSNTKWMNGAGEMIPRNEVSRRKALAWCKAMEIYAPVEVVDKWDTDQFQGGFNKGGNKGGFNRGGQNNYGGGNRGGGGYNGGGYNGGGNSSGGQSGGQEPMVNFDEFNI